MSKMIKVLATPRTEGKFWEDAETVIRKQQTAASVRRLWQVNQD